MVYIFNKLQSNHKDIHVSVTRTDNPTLYYKHIKSFITFFLKNKKSFITFIPYMYKSNELTYHIIKSKTNGI